MSLLDNPNGPTGPVYSSKGIGEPPLLIGAAAVLTAIRRAVQEYRRVELGCDEWVQIDPPATAEKVLAAAHGRVHEYEGVIQM